MTRLACDLAGLTFQNPILLAAGTAGYGNELVGVTDLDRLGGIVCKAVSVLPRAGNAPPRVAEFPGGMLNSIGLANPGLASVCAHHLPQLVSAVSRCRVLVNVVGFTVQEYAEVVMGLDEVEGLAAYELNLSCPNTGQGGVEFGADPVQTAAVVSRCRSATARPLIIKLSPVLADLASIAAAAVDSGADAIAVVNTMPGWLPALSGRDGARLGAGQGGVSGPLLLPTGLLAVQRVRERTGAPVIGVGGIRRAADVLAYLNAGATLVAIGTAALAHPRLPERIVTDLERMWRN